MVAEYRFKLPVSEEDVRKLRVGDIIYVSGTMVTARDQAHRRVLELVKKGEKPPIDLRGLAVYHCGPVVRKRPDGTWEIIAAGPTTSTRMEILEAEFIEATGARIIIGKGGMGPRTAEACRKYGAVYAVFTGGAAVLAAKAIKRVKDVYWLDLGIPEAMWVLEVEDFGPLVVTIDSTGKNLYDDIMNQARKRLEEEIYPRIGFG
jgi:fumarate hydratase subunit beta